MIIFFESFRDTFSIILLCFGCGAVFKILLLSGSLDAMKVHEQYS